MKKDRVKTLLAQFEKGGFVPEPAAEQILAAYDIPVPPSAVTKTPEEGVRAAKKIGWPVVLKIISPQIIHKSDAGGIVVGVDSEKKLISSYNTILQRVKKSNPRAKIEGIYLQKMTPSSREVIVGTTQDKQFGPVIMFGLGGIFVEVLKDVVFRVAPIGKTEARQMVNEIRALAILKGTRGDKPIDFDSLYSAISNISRLVYDFPQIQELDANPISVSSTGLCALDARIILNSTD